MACIAVGCVNIRNFKMYTQFRFFHENQRSKYKRYFLLIWKPVFSPQKIAKLKYFVVYFLVHFVTKLCRHFRNLLKITHFILPVMTYFKKKIAYPLEGGYSINNLWNLKSIYDCNNSK